MKYVILTNGEPIVFPDTLGHNEVVNKEMVRSAGFCMIETFRTPFDDIRAKVSVWGKSDSLNKTSNAEDAEIIKKIWRI